MAASLRCRAPLVGSQCSRGAGSFRGCQLHLRVVKSRDGHFWTVSGRGMLRTSSSNSDTSHSRALAKEIAKLGAMRPHPCSLQEILDMREPAKLAKFIHAEVPVRYAERVREIELLPDWGKDSELSKMREHHIDVFEDIRLMRERKRRNYSSISSLDMQDHLKTFDDVVQHAHEFGGSVPARITQVMHRLSTIHGEQFTASFVDRWLDDFLLNWIGCETLLMQYIACSRGQQNGIIDPSCDVADLCQKTASLIQDMCEDVYGLRPHIVVESFSTVETDQRAPSFSYIPMFLRFIMQEILKNSCRAILSTCPEEKLPKRPTNVAVCADEQQVAIRITDRGRGVPFHIGEKVWSYMYSTGSKIAQCHPDVQDGPTPLSGYGIGLPLSRLYCRYLGGQMNLVSWPGRGVDVHLSLPRVSSKQIEVIPVPDVAILK